MWIFGRGHYGDVAWKLQDGFRSRAIAGGRMFNSSLTKTVEKTNEYNLWGDTASAGFASTRT